jgi:O-acetylhomoserine (thiol)-lyase
VTPGLVRLAVGIESIKDILADLDAGFAAAQGGEGSSDDELGLEQPADLAGATAG